MNILKSEDVKITFGSAHDDDEYYIEWRDQQNNPHSFIAMSTKENNHIHVYIGDSTKSIIMDLDDFEKLLKYSRHKLENAKSNWLDYLENHPEHPQ